ncbi:MAG: DUF1284 domain-containing protein [Nitrospiraceae bacterium]
MADLHTSLDPYPPIRLRGHTLLCLQGFRGEGYSPEFVSNMAVIHQALTTDPNRQIEVIASPDAVCGACPHRQLSGCTLNGERSEEAMVEQDREVMRRLGLTAGDRLRWGDLLERIQNSVSGEDLPLICGGCRWLPLGYCREGINRLRETTDSETVVGGNRPERICQEPSRM